MKLRKFNPKWEMLKLRMKQNKSKYITYGSLLISIIVLIIGIMFFSYSKYTTTHVFPLINATVGDFSKNDIGIVAYYLDGTVITHRVVENRFVEGVYVTKGDANDREDFTNARYHDLVGIVKYHIPLLGNYLMIYSNPITKFYLILVALIGVMLNVLASRMRAWQEEKFRRQVEQWEKRQVAKRKAELEEIRKQNSQHSSYNSSKS